MGMYFILAWRNIWRNKRRSVISISSILFAVIIALATRSMQMGFYAKAISNVVSFYTGYAQIHAKDFWDKRSLDQSFVLSDSMLNSVAQIKQVTVTAPRLESFGLASSGDITDGTMLLGIEPEPENRLTSLKSRLVEGSYLSPNDNGILLSQGLAEHLKVNVGDTMVVLSQGYHGVTAAGVYPVVGFVKFPTPELNSGMAYLSLSEAQTLFGADGRATSLAVMIKNQKQLPQVMSELTQKFSKDFEVMSWQDMLPELVQYIKMDNASGIIMLWIIYLVIAFGILGTILMMTLERNREFGMMIAIGMKRNRLRLIVIIESLLLTFTGVLAGIIAGIPVLLYLYSHPIVLKGEYAKVMLAYGFEPLMPFSLDPSIFLWQAVSVLIIALAVSIYPVWRISKIHPVSALRTS
jgi:putative ABC transport system permease protein